MSRYDLESLAGVTMFLKSKNAIKQLEKAKKEGIVGRLLKTDESADHKHFNFKLPARNVDSLEYHIALSLTSPPAEVLITCSCPAAQKQSICKHGVAALLYRLSPSDQRPSVGQPTTATEMNALNRPPPSIAHLTGPPRRRIIPASFRGDGGGQGNTKTAALQPGKANTRTAAAKTHPSTTEPVADMGKKRWLTGYEMAKATDEELLTLCNAAIEKGNVDSFDSVEEILDRRPAKRAATGGGVGLQVQVREEIEDTTAQVEQQLQQLQEQPAVIEIEDDDDGDLSMYDLFLKSLNS